MKKFVPFLVKTVSKSDIPSDIEASVPLPAWWPKDIQFSTEIFTEELPANVMLIIINIINCLADYHANVMIFLDICRNS